MSSRGSGSGVGFDEHAGFDRPHRTRPRTKDRPDYSRAPVGMVVTIDRGRYRVLLEVEGEERHITAAKARQLGRMGVIVGDRVRLDGDVSAEEGTLARIVEVLERDTVLRRTADDDDPYERAIVANADQLVIVTALADPPPRVGMIDRILVAAFDARIEPLLLLTKADLASPDELAAAYTPLGVPVLATRPGGDLDELRAWLAGHRTVFVGHSGVGKSTLVNALIPGAGRAIGKVNDVTGRGRQTSTSAIVLELPPYVPPELRERQRAEASGGEGVIPLSTELRERQRAEVSGGEGVIPLSTGLRERQRAEVSGGEGVVPLTTGKPGWVIDTPGVRSFGLSHVTRENIVAAFGDLARFAEDCPRGCSHETGAPECALDLAVARGELAPARLESFRRMLGSGQ